MNKIPDQPMDALILDRLIVAISCLEDISDLVKSFRLDEAIRLLILELDKHWD